MSEMLMCTNVIHFSKPASTSNPVAARCRFCRLRTALRFALLRLFSSKIAYSTSDLNNMQFAFRVTDFRLRANFASRLIRVPK